MQVDSNQQASKELLQIVLYPELVAEALKNKEGELYLLWSILKAMDRRFDGSGKIKAQDLLTFIKRILKIEQSRAYEIMRKGVGKYWNAPGKDFNGDKVVGLIGRANVIKRLHPISTRSEPFTISQKHLGFANTQDVKNLLIAIVAARYTDYRPVSLKSISVSTGCSVSTVKRAINRYPDVNSHTNILHISSHANYKDAKVAYDLLEKDKPSAFKIKESNGCFTVCRQLPNVYELCSPGRLPISKRPRELKNLDHANMVDLDKKRYYKKSSKKPVSYEHLQYSGVDSTESGMQIIWTPQNIQPKTKDARSIAAKWRDISKKIIRL